MLRPLIGAAVVVTLLAATTAVGRHRPTGPVRSGPVDAAALTDDQRRGTLRFDSAVHPLDRQVILAAIAQARPEARRLIDMVDGAVTVRVAPTGARAAGFARYHGSGYEVVLDLASVSQHLGTRGISRLVLHELAHVVDGALVTEELERTLDADIPRGYACGSGARDGACASRKERFAETFAKWATGDIGAELYIGYRILPPPSLDEWGRPLARVGT